MDFATILCFLLVCVLVLHDFVATRRKYRKLPPGPRGFPLVGYLPFLGEEPYKTMMKLTDKYGNIFSLQLGRKRVVVLNDYDTIKDLLSRPEVLSRSPDNFSVVGDCGPLTSNGKVWVLQRRLFMQVVKDIGMSSGHWNKILKEEVNGVLQKLSKQNGDPVDIWKLLAESTIISLTTLGIGKQLQEGVNDDTIELLKDFGHTVSKLSGSVSLLGIIPGIKSLLELFNIGGYRDAARTIERLEQYLKQEVQNHVENEELSSAKDLINGYRQKFEEKASNSLSGVLSDDNIYANLKLLYLAASDTNVAAMDWLFRMMALCPEVQGKVHTELDRVLVDNWYLTYEQHSLAPYTFASVMESLRFSSVAPLPPSRRTTGDIEVDGFIIPKGTEIASNIYAVHNNPKHWTNPEKFEPQRFIAEDGTVIRSPDYFIPFSLGKRNCPGENVAYMTMMVYFTAIMKKFYIECPPGETVNTATSIGIVRKLQTQKLRFIKRECAACTLSEAS